MRYEQIEELSGLLKSISHPIRLKILCLLRDRELSVSELRESVETSGANITQHLNILRNQGVLSFRKESNYIYNRIADERIIGLMKSMQQLFCTAAKNNQNRKKGGSNAAG